jgi:hypothetical protein
MTIATLAANPRSLNTPLPPNSGRPPTAIEDGRTPTNRRASDSCTGFPRARRPVTRIVVLAANYGPPARAASVLEPLRTKVWE